MQIFWWYLSSNQTLENASPKVADGWGQGIKYATEHGRGGATPTQH